MHESVKVTAYSRRKCYTAIGCAQLSALHVGSAIGKLRISATLVTTETEGTEVAEGTEGSEGSQRISHRISTKVQKLLPTTNGSIIQPSEGRNVALYTSVLIHRRSNRTGRHQVLLQITLKRGKAAVVQINPAILQNIRRRQNTP